MLAEIALNLPQTCFCCSLWQPWEDQCPWPWSLSSTSSHDLIGGSKRYKTCYTVNSEIFVRIIFANNMKRHICHVKNYSQLVHALYISEKDRVISPYSTDFILTKLGIPKVAVCEVSQK